MAIPRRRLKKPDGLRHDYTLLSSLPARYKVAGVDEVALGPLAGPIVACAIVFPAEHLPLQGVTDSKQLSHHKMDQLFEDILDRCTDYGLGVVESDEIDKVGLGEAHKRVLHRALQQLEYTPDHTYVDGDKYIRRLGDVEFVVKGDARIWIVGAASIVAKVEQKRLMEGYHERWPRYGFDSHAGYGTKKHLEALRVYGPCPIHRRACRPVREAER